MKGYAKIKENNPFSQRSKSKKENPFLDQHLDVNSSNLHAKNPQENDQKPNIFEDDLLQAKTDDHDHEETKTKVSGNVLRRNLTVSGSTTSYGYQKNGKSSKLERQRSTRVIQEAVKRAFSMRRCSSVNNSSSNSDRYCRIYDQPKNVEDSDYVYDDYGNHDGFEKKEKNKNKDDYDYDYNYDYSNNNNNNNNNNNRSNNSGKKHVGSKVVKACKRLFSR